MKFEDWKPLYDEILAEFRFDPVADEAAASELAAFLQQAGCDPGAVWRDLRARLGGRGCIVLGAADEAPERLRHAPADWPLVAADGATTAALEVGRLPDLIVTDLDGRVEDEVAAAARGSLVAVHAHGDNREALARWLPQFPPRPPRRDLPMPARAAAAQRGRLHGRRPRRLPRARARRVLAAARGLLP